MLPLLSLVACRPPDPPTSLAGSWLDVDADGVASFFDCNDRDPLVRPGISDPWYDGVDSNCDGRDDYDQDGDGFGWVAHGGTDCDDVVPEVTPAAEEVVYDGIDNDCRPDTRDDDLDGDGFPRTSDCDDADPLAAPGGYESLGDDRDGDCDGHVDSTALAWLDATFVGLVGPSAEVVGDEILVAVFADEWAHATGTEAGAGLLFVWPADAQGALPLSSFVTWRGGLDDDPVGALDLLRAGDDLYVGHTWQSLLNNFGYVGANKLVRSQADTWVTAQLWGSGEYGTTYDHVDIELDRDGIPWMVGCGETSTRFVEIDDQPPASAAALAGHVSGCVVDASSVPPLPVTGCTPGGGCTTYQPDLAASTLVPGGTSPLASADVRVVRQRHGWLAAAREGGGVYVTDGDDEWDLLDGLEVLDVEALSVGDDVWIAAVVDDTFDERIVLAFGAPGAGAQSVVTFSTLTDVERVSLALAPGRLVLAFSGHDQLGIMVLGR